MMRLMAFVMVVAIAATPALAEDGMALVFDVPEETFIAVTVELAALSPAKVAFKLMHCHGFQGSPGSRGLFLIENGRLTSGFVNPGVGTLVLDPTTVEAGIEGDSFSLPLYEPDLAPYVIMTFSCPPQAGVWTWDRSGGNESLTLTYVAWSSRLPGVAYLNLTTLQGVERIDAWSGPATVIKPQQFEHGASVAIAPPLGFNGAAAGALLSQRLTPEHDFLGYWWPWRGEVQGHWWCDMNETGGCPMPWNEHYMTLTSKGATTWDVGYDHYAQVDASQHYALLGIDLGRDDVLAG